MAVNVFKLVGQIFVENTEANKKIEETDSKIENTTTSFGQGIAKAAEWGKAIVNAGISVATSLYNMAQKSADAADNIDKMSQKIGISREAYQELDFICSQSGTSVDILQSGLKTLTNQMQSASEGSEKATAKFEALGLSWTDNAGNLKSQETMLYETLEALQNCTNETEKSALAVDLFGKAGTELMPLLNSESGSIEELKKKAQELGLVMSDEDVDAGVQMKDAMDQLDRSFTALTNKLGAKVVPIVTKLINIVIDNMPTIERIFEQMVEVFEPALQLLFDAIVQILNIAGEVKEWMEEHETAAQLIAAAIIAITAAVAAYNIVQKACAIATAVTTAATTAWGVAVAVATSPITLIIVAIAALVAAIYLLCENWDAVKEAGELCWEGIKDAWNGVADWFEDNVIDPVANMFDALAQGVEDTWNGIVDGILSVVQSVIDAYNDSIGAIGFTFPDWIPGIGGESWSIPNIPNVLASGGIVDEGQLYIANEKGPELIESYDGKNAVVNNAQVIDSTVRGVSQGISNLKLDVNLANNETKTNPDKIVTAIDGINQGISNLKSSEKYISESVVEKSEIKERTVENNIDNSEILKAIEKIKMPQVSAEEIATAVANAISKVNITATVSGDEVFNSVKKKNQRYFKATGRNALIN